MIQRTGKNLKNTKKENSLRSMDTRPLVVTSAACFMLLILVTLIASLIQGTNASGKAPGSGNIPVVGEPEITAPPTDAPVPDKYSKSMLAVIQSVDSEQNQITLIHAETDEIITLEYTGGSDIRNKYGKVIAGAQLTPGDLAEVSYQGVTRKLVSLSVNTDGWECNAISGLIIDTGKKMLSFLGNRYTYSDGLLLLSNGKKISLADLEKTDVLTIRGYKEKICSITVTRGHGYIKLTEESDFIGGLIEVGMLLSEQIQEGMVLTVPEGTYEVKISNRGYSGTEKMTIKRDEISTLQADAYGPTGIQNGRVTFQIQPENAVLYIDGKETFFALPIELSYGEHTIEATLGGYHSYQGTIQVDRTEAKFRIILSEKNSSSETDNSGGTGEWDNPDPEDGDSETGKNDNTITDWPEDDWPEDDWPDDDSEDDDSEDETSGEEDNNQENDSKTDPKPDSGNPDNSNTTGDNSGGNSGNDSTSEVEGGTHSIDSSHTLTIRCTNGAKVYIDGIYVGEIENGEVVLPKYLGQLDISLLYRNDMKRYTLDVADDKKDTSFTFPGF